MVPEEPSDDNEETDSPLKSTIFGDIEPVLKKENNTVGHDSLLLNKYEVEIEESPMEVLSNVIIDWEINNGIENEFIDDLQDDPQEVRDEVLEEMSDSVICNGSDSAVIIDQDNAQQIALKHVEKIKKKMEKISIAPGEHGNFKNWGDDLFLEVFISNF